MNRTEKTEQYYENFRSLLKQMLDDATKNPPERYSTRWFFLRYVRRLLQLSKKTVLPKDLDSTVRGITRFYIDLEQPSYSITESFESIRREYSALKRIAQKIDINSAR